MVLRIAFGLSIIAVLMTGTGCTPATESTPETSAAPAADQTPATPPQKVKINFPTRSGASWPMFIAKQAGYYAKYGYDVDLVFGPGTTGFAMVSSGEAVMSNASMEQAAQASSRDGSFTWVGSSLNRGFFALMASKDISNVQGLKGKRFGISQIGDAPYNYSVAILAKFGLTARDIQWVPVGTDANGRAAALAGGRVDATLLTAPAFFRLEEQGFKRLANMDDYDDVYASTVYLFKKSSVAENPKLAEAMIKAHAEAIKRFGEDKAFAIQAYVAFDKQDQADVERIYERYKQGDAFEKVPFVLDNAFKSVLSQADKKANPQIETFDFRTVIDNSIVDRMVAEGFFEKLFGQEIRAEQERKAKLAFR
jgi:ABC-type nitrate/sulfonate/bicarbonate transport system substrate-binding protein